MSVGVAPGRCGVRRYDGDMARRPWMLWLLAFLVFELLWTLVWLTDRALLLEFVS